MSRVTTHFRPGTNPRGEDARRRLIETALEVFALNGYEGASTRILAERAAVNLPAIQYYFGSKEGLYRAAIDDIIAQIAGAMAPLGARIEVALARRELAPAEALALLSEHLDAFVALVLGGQSTTSRKLFIARAEIEWLAAIDPLHDSMIENVVRPAAALVGRLIGRPAEDDSTLLRTLAILGQVTVFCNKPARRALGRAEFGPADVAALQALVREHLGAIFGAGKVARP